MNFVIKTVNFGYKMVNFVFQMVNSCIYCYFRYSCRRVMLSGTTILYSTIYSTIYSTTAAR